MSKETKDRADYEKGKADAQRQRGFIDDLAHHIATIGGSKAYQDGVRAGQATRGSSGSKKK